MDLGSLLFITGILIMVAFFIAQPLIKHKPYWMSGDDQKLSALTAEQERIISVLVELDFDYNLGKIPAEEYPAQRRFMLAQGAKVMQQLDTLRAQKENRGIEINLEANGNLQGIESSKEPVRKERGGKRPLKTPDDDLEVLLAARRRERGEKAGGFCSQCGNPVQQSDRFCPRCGEALSTGNNNNKK
jgi:hypothetical protein